MFVTSVSAAHSMRAMLLPCWAGYTALLYPKTLCSVKERCLGGLAQQPGSTAKLHKAADTISEVLSITDVCKKNI